MHFRKCLHAYMFYQDAKSYTQCSDHVTHMLQVLEETGFDMSSRLKSNDYIEIHMQEKRCRLYIIQGASSQTLPGVLHHPHCAVSFSPLDQAQMKTLNILSITVNLLPNVLAFSLLFVQCMWVSLQSTHMCYYTVYHESMSCSHFALQHSAHATCLIALPCRQVCVTFNFS